MLKAPTRNFIKNIHNSYFLHKPPSLPNFNKSGYLSYHSLDKSKSARKVNLILEDGRVMKGYSFGYEKSTSGEVVFNTGLVGYPESLTDPSYKGQILSLTYPIVGNYGVPDTKATDKFGLLKHVESDKIHVQGLIVQDYTDTYSHWNAVKSLSEWLIEERVPGIFGIDTRMLTKLIRHKDTVVAKIEFEDDPVDFNNPCLNNLIAQVSTKQVREFGDGPLNIVAIDCGIKQNIIRNLVSRGAKVRLVPWNYDFTKEKYDGLFISNGPGDPKTAAPTISNVKQVMENREEPIFGICLGNQLISLAAGAKCIKLPFGNRGQNQTVINLLNKKAHITAQNHSFVVDVNTLPSSFKPLFINANDNTNEGIIHETKPIFSAQFHPEAWGGPLDTEFLFDVFIKSVKQKSTGKQFPSAYIQELLLDHYKEAEKFNKPKIENKELPKSVLVLGSGGISIGQAGEFDYSGSQAIKALKEENIKVILINPNIASIQTNKHQSVAASKSADEIYFVPVTPDYVAEVIRKERPEGILLSMGGQTALNTGVKLWETGVLKEYNVRVLGTPVETIVDTEDRALFKDRLNEINEKLAPSFEAYNIKEAAESAKKIGYPVMVRSAFALGGLGSGICENEAQLVDLCEKAFANTNQVLVEKSLLGWKEVEYEVVRDTFGNCVTICNMENLDPLGVHTGDSVVVAPSQTLSNEEYHMLRTTSIKVINHLGIIGECNIQYALSPDSLEYYIIEVNARLSRSSALASKATGYPLAFIATKLSLGLPITEIKNVATKYTTACFEPSLDYIVTKIPIWDLDRFAGAQTSIDSAMKSVGEVMAIGRTFEESFQKALRSTHPSVEGFTDLLPFKKDYPKTFDMISNLKTPNNNRIYVIGKALKDGMSVDEIHNLTKIDKWFLKKMKNLLDFQLVLKDQKTSSLNPELLMQAKQFGFSDKQLGKILNKPENEMRQYRQILNIKPFVKQIDTMAAEYPAYTNYLYCTYNGMESDIEFNDNGVIVLGCGPYHIGSSVEFDYCAVSCIRSLKNMNENVIMINLNPETISTDFDEADRLYFEELTLERVLDIYQLENSKGVIVSMSGQLPNNLAMPLHNNAAKILGTNALMIHQAEERNAFSKILDDMQIDQAPWASCKTLESATEFANRVGYPCLLRPSYVLSGSAMNVAYNDEELVSFLKQASRLSGEHPVVITKFIEHAKEIELDGVSDSGKMVSCVLSEHLEEAGVHSGDATLILPTLTISPEVKEKMKDIASKIAQRLEITGPFNVQYLVKNNHVMVIECNLRASRSFPFIAKSVNRDLIDVATKAIMKKRSNEANTEEIELQPHGFFGIKAPMFSWPRIKNADPVLQCQMSSTGEVASYSKDIHKAYLKALVSSGFKIPSKAVLFVADESYTKDLLKTAESLNNKGLKIYATQSIANYFNANNVPTTAVSSPSDNSNKKLTEAAKLLQDKTVDLVINLHSKNSKISKQNYVIRRGSVDRGIPLITNFENAVMFGVCFEKVNEVEADTLEYYQQSTNDSTTTEAEQKTQNRIK